MVKNNKLKTGITARSVLIDGTNVILSLIDDAGEIGRQTIGAAIGNVLLTGIGNFIGGILGGLIDGFIGNQIGHFICALFPEVAEGSGAPMPFYFPFFYGQIDVFSAPPTRYEVDDSGMPRSKYGDVNPYGAPPSSYR